MLILKGTVDKKNQISDDEIFRIAKYAINFMAGIKLFDENGNFNPTSTEKFPLFNVCNMDMFIKAAGGVIILPVDVDRELFIEKFIIQLGICEKTYMDTAHPNYLNKYHSVNNSIYSTLKIKSALLGIVPCVENNENVKNSRILVTTKSRDHMKTGSRFIWRVINTNYVQLEITNRNRLASFEMHVLSILYDTDTTNYAPNEFIYTFKPQKCVSYVNICKNMEINLSCIAPHIQLEFAKVLKSYTSSSDNIETLKYRATGGKNLNRHTITTLSSYNIYEAELVNEGKSISPHVGCEIELTAVTKKNCLRNDICSLCVGALFDENYVFVSYKDHTKNVHVSTVCAYCAHFGPQINIYQPQFIFKVKWPRSMKDQIESLRMSKDKKKILIDASTNGVYRTFIDVDDDDDDETAMTSIKRRCLLIGNNYIGVIQLEDYLFGNLHKIYPNRQAILINPNTQIHLFPVLQQN